MEHIKDILESYFKKRKTGKFLSDDKQKELQLLTRWKEIIGEEFCDYTKPYKIYNNKLFIYVENSVIISELIYQKRRIIEIIKNKISLSIKDIIFQIKKE